jgi:hypothetical protein
MVKITSVHRRPIISDQRVCRIFMKFGVGFLYNRLSSECEFSENGLSHVRTLLTGAHTLLAYILYLFTNFGEFRCTKSPRNPDKQPPSFVKKTAQ